MTYDIIEKRIAQRCSHFTFEYEGESCGVDPIYNPDKGQRYEMWFGYKKEHTAYTVDEVMNTPIFLGRSLKEIAEKIDIIDF